MRLSRIARQFFYELFVNLEKTPFLYDSYEYKESNVKNQLFELIFHTAICAERHK